MGWDAESESGCLNFKGSGIERCQLRTWKSRKEMSSLEILRSDGDEVEVSCEATDLQTLLPIME